MNASSRFATNQFAKRLAALADADGQEVAIGVAELILGDVRRFAGIKAIVDGHDENLEFVVAAGTSYVVEERLIVAGVVGWQ